MASAKDVLQKASVALRQLDDVQMNAIFQALLTMTDHGVLVTDLKHNPLACNSNFGRIFRVASDDVPFMEVEELRSFVYPRLRDPESWRKQLDEVYARPEDTHEDVLELIDEKPVFLKRKTSPLFDSQGRIVGRLWRFEDVTEERRRSLRRAITTEVASFHSPEPEAVMQFVVEAVGRYFESISLLSIWQDDLLVFRKVANMPPEGSEMRSNTWDNSYCRETIRTQAPFVVLDARADDRFCEISPAQAGMIRYGGVPIFNMSGECIGTLCFLDDRCGTQVNDDELEFMTVLAQRLSTELERERLYDERTSEQRRTLERQSAELAATQDVLGAMNRAFQFLSEPSDEPDLIAQQTALLEGLLGYSTACLAVFGEAGCTATISEGGAIKRLNVAPKDSLRFAGLFDEGGTPQTLEVNQHSFLGSLTSEPWATLVRLPIDLETPYVLVLGSPEPIRHDLRHLAHLTAILDQIALVFALNSLNQQLRQANEELSATQTRLIESEKLSVVGTLSASVAHDIRNIMASVSLECATPGNDPIDTLNRVKSHLDRFGVLSHRLLSYAKPKRVAQERIDLNELVERSASMLSTQVRVTNVQLTMTFDKNLPNVVADPHRIEHLFVNLMLNALQAMKTSGGQLRVWTVADSGGALVVVEDNGRGIQQENVSKLFEPFFSTRDDGFGLGLFSCRQIAQEHGWHLAVRSEVGVGTRFTISIPKEKLNQP